MTDTVAGIAVPDTALTREITEYIRDTEDDLLYHHSRRVFFFGALVGQAQELSVDHELLYAGAMFHDRGLTQDHQESMLRFEVDGANDVFEFLMERGASRDRAHSAWLGIALHTTPGIPEFMAPEVALVSAGVETDVLGMHLDEGARMPAEPWWSCTRARTSRTASSPRSTTAWRTARAPRSAP